MKIGNLLLFVLLLLGNDVMAINTTKIQGRVNEATEQKILFSQKNIITKEVIKKSLFIGEGGFFSVTLEDEGITAGLITLTYNDIEIPVFYESGQNIVVQFNAKLGLSSVRFSGDGAINNLYLIKSQSKFKSLEAAIDKKIQEGSSNTFKEDAHKLHSEKLKYYLNFKIKVGEFTDQFDSYARAEINYWKALKLLEYRWRKSIFAGKPGNVTLTKSYYFFLDDIKINNSKAIISETYQEFLYEYLRYAYEEQIKAKKITEEVKSLTITGNMISLRMNPTSDNVNFDGTGVSPLTLQKDEKVQFLKRSSFISELPINGELVTYPWYLVKMKNRRMGWVYGGRVSRTNEFFDFENSCYYKMANENLTGEARDFIIVGELYNEMKNNPNELNFKIARDYITESNNEVYNNLLLSVMGSGRSISSNARAQAPANFKNEQTEKLDGEIDNINDQLKELQATQQKMKELQDKLKAEQDKKERLRKIAEIQARIDAEEAENERIRKMQEEKQRKSQELKQLLEQEKDNLRKADERYRQQSSNSKPAPKAEPAPIESTKKPEEVIVSKKIERESTVVSVPKPKEEVIVKKEEPIAKAKKPVEVVTAPAKKQSPTPPRPKEVVDAKKKAQNHPLLIG